MEIFQALLLTGVLLLRTLSKGQLVDCGQLRLLKGVWSSPGTRHFVIDKRA
jgi:hypothetical protein